MITVSNNEDVSLIYWRQNKNTSNVGESNFSGNRLCLKPYYLSVFEKISERLKNRPATSFVELWKDIVAEAELDVFKFVKSSSGCSPESAHSVAIKFRGNLAEIFTEKLFETGQGVFKANTYVPVDPHNERGTDATAVSAISGLTVGIQVKNYSHDKVDISVFRTAGDESDRYLHMISPEQFTLFLSHPNQYILSFTDAEQILREEYEGRVGFLGPGWLDSLGLQGRRGEKCGRWLFFREIADEIENLV